MVTFRDILKTDEINMNIIKEEVAKEMINNEEIFNYCNLSDLIVHGGKDRLIQALKIAIPQMIDMHPEAIKKTPYIPDRELFAILTILNIN